jgi:hypothetical protein
MTDDDVVTAMSMYGGSFVRGLATLWRFADPVNQARLKLAFADYWTEYAEVATLRGISAPWGPRVTR